jgi:hypothetical protein
MSKLTTSNKEKENIFSINSTLISDKSRELTGLDVTDEKAHEIIHSIRLFCNALYQLSVSKNNRYIEGRPGNSVDDNILNEAA